MALIANQRQPDNKHQPDNPIVKIEELAQRITEIAQRATEAPCWHDNPAGAITLLER